MAKRQRKLKAARMRQEKEQKKNGSENKKLREERIAKARRNSPKGARETRKPAVQRNRSSIQLPGRRKTLFT